MNDLRQQLVDWIDADRDRLVAFLSQLVQARSPNPPGDTRDAAACIMRFLDAAGAPYRIVAPAAEMPNIVGTVDGGRPGKHLVLNGHIDVFPPPNEAAWTHGPWSGAVANGKLYGCGSSDMKQGTASMVFAYCYLHRLREHLSGRLTRTAVSDEETFGPNGARYLVEHEAEVRGDCLLNAEPGAPTTIRFGEKAPLWLSFRIETPGCHGAYTHKSKSATKIAAALILDLEAVTEIPVELPPVVAKALAEGAGEIDRIHVAGAYETMRRVTLNVGGYHGGSLVNMLPGLCTVDADIRLPIGMTKEPVLQKVGEILQRYPEATMTIVNDSRSNWSDPEHPMVGFLQANAREVAGIEARPITSLAGTDARLWRFAGIPAFSYGTTATNVAMPDEHTEIDEWIKVVKTHALSAFDYLRSD